MASNLPAVGSRFMGGEGSFAWVLEYVGPNPAPMYEQQHACIIRVVETCEGGPTVGTELAVEPKWFETHRPAKAGRTDAEMLRELRALERKVERTSEARRLLPPGSSRARVTTANARWSTACAARDRLQAELQRRGVRP
jgi:hypothetical protein